MYSRIAHRIVASRHPIVLAALRLRRAVLQISLPFPPVVLRPFLWGFLGVRTILYFLYSRLVCEPIFRAYCREVGRRFRTGVHIHWVTGGGDIIVGDDVTLHGKSSIMFAARFSPSPTFSIGDHTTIGHGCTFIVAKHIAIGRHCLIGNNVRISDSNGHPLDPVRRRAGASPDPEDVRPVIIADDVWVGADVTIFPAVTIGEGAVVAARSVVTTHVPPYTLVGGHPARRLQVIDRASNAGQEGDAGVRHLLELSPPAP